MGLIQMTPGHKEAEDLYGRAVAQTNAQIEQYLNLD